jgi:hypothetical protein
MYNQDGVDALDGVRVVVASFGTPRSFRKLYGILTALEMHVEDTLYSVKTLQHLGKAWDATARRIPLCHKLLRAAHQTVMQSGGKPMHVPGKHMRTRWHGLTNSDSHSLPTCQLSLPSLNGTAMERKKSSCKPAGSQNATPKTPAP